MKATIHVLMVVLGLSLAALPAFTAHAGTPAVRQGDGTSHAGGVVVGGSPTVLIGGMPAARVGDYVVCPLATPIPHVGGPIVTGSGTVLINGVPAALTGSIVAETGGIPSTLVGGAVTVLIGN
jgi:uncharacterized Zn-binding protein involved in type VI secretion